MDNVKMHEEIAELQTEFTKAVFNIADKYGKNKEDIFCKTVESFEFMGVLILSGAVNFVDVF